MKIQLKHIAPYLPYGLKLKYTHTGKIDEIFNIYTIGNGYTNDDIKLSIYQGGDEHIWMFKPILRPLSDLKAFGDEFLTGHQINNIIESEFDTEYGVFEFYSGELYFEREGDSSQAYDSAKQISFALAQRVRDLLLEAHYDIFGLIPAGLAVDVNTIEK